MVDGGEQSSPSFIKGNVMTIQKLIDKVQEEKPNTFQTDKLIEFINEIEADVAEQINLDIPSYTEEDMNKDLMAPSPYDRLYVSYLKAMIDYANEEYASYQLNQAQHNQDFTDFVNWIVRTGQSDKSLIPSRFTNVF